MEDEVKKDASRLIPYLASQFRQEQFMRMQIHLDIGDYEFNKHLREKINEVEDLDKYIDILPKSIQINTDY